tara:strand:- start:1005 stop:1901 length:897 start_codon:yes stop_codon:yes gene_type:complete
VVKLPLGVDIDNLIDDLRVLSWEVADILLFYSKKFKESNHDIDIIKTKINHDPVTLADLEVNDMIIRRINEKYKGINWEILSEENVKDESICNTNAEWLWVLDPLDGTKDFIQGTNNYAMHLALNHKQTSYIGVVLIPEKDELWITDGDKLWCERRKKSYINPSLVNKKNLQEMILVTSKNHRNKTLNNLINKIGFKEIKVVGSIGCKIASIIRGESDIYICLSLPGGSSPKDWDFAAPEAILKAAGGSITNLDNQELIYGKSYFEQGGIIVATRNKLTHKNICSQIKEIIEQYDLII